MELSRKERLMLANQFRIMDKLNPNNGYDTKAHILEWGFEAQYGSLFDHVFDPPMTVGECRQVGDIMEMYQALKIGYDRLADKSGINESVIKFCGFDHNSESFQVAYANFLQKQGQFTDIGTGNLDQGVLTIQMYKRMLEVWDEIPEGQRYPLSKESIEQLVDAQTHPENRKVTT